jgi:hypothetical protein
MNAVYDEKNGMARRDRAPTTRHNKNFIVGKRSNFGAHVMQQLRQGSINQVCTVN